VAAGLAARKARDLKVDSFATVVHGAGNGGMPLETAARATMESSILALYRYEQFKEATKSTHQVSACTIVESGPDRASQLEKLAQLARMTGDGGRKCAT